LALSVVDSDNSGDVSYDEFAKWWKDPNRFVHLAHIDDELSSKVAAVFTKYDKEKKGSLTSKEFIKMFQDLQKTKIGGGKVFQFIQTPSFFLFF